MGEPLDAEHLARQIWPEARVVRKHSPTSYTALPSARDPRMFLPSDRRLAVAALRARTTPTTRRERLRNGAVTAAVALGGVRPLRGAVIETAGNEPSLLERLSEVIGTHLSAGVHLGPPRANRKPVLALRDRAGDVVAYAKLGVNDLTAALVRNEAMALDSLSQRRDHPFRSPLLIRSEVWHGAELLVMSPIDLPPRPKRPTHAALGLVVRSIAASGFPAEEHASALLDRVAESNRRLGTRESPALATFIGRLRASAADRVLPTGAWHGDFAPGNVVTGPDDRLVVLDWERYEPAGAPLGMDLSHYLVRHRAHTLGHGMAAAIAELSPAMPAQLKQYGLDTLGSHLVFAIYLARLAVRYLSDDNFGTERRERALQEWFRGTVDIGGRAVCP